MQAVAKAISHVVRSISPDVEELQILVIFCGTGLTISILAAHYCALDLTSAF
jgi:hypothetical protein